MNRQMCWLKDSRNPQIMILHLREYPYQSWQPYNVSNYAVPDYRIPGGSKGWATFQHLRRSGWTLISSAEASKSTVIADRISPKAA